MRSKATDIGEQLAVDKVNQGIVDFAEAHGLSVERGEFIHPKEDMEMLRAYVLFSHFVDFWKRYACV